MLDSEKEQEQLYKKLNLETAPIPWSELQRHFASGMVVAIADGLDLIQVAACMAKDDHVAVKQWMQANQITKVSDEQAQTWLRDDALLWTVVVKPWVLVQQKKAL